MPVKRYTRGPILWIVVVVVALLVALELLSGSGGDKKIDTSKALQEISDNQVKYAQGHRHRPAHRADAEER